MSESSKHLNKPVINIIRKNIAKLPHNITVSQALEDIREKGIGDRIVYFYVVNENGSLIGVVPTRRLLTASLFAVISEIMIKRVITIPENATILETYEFFLLYKFLAFPVVNQEKQILGVVDISMFTDDTFDAANQETMDKMFETIGFRIMQVREASPFKAFRFRFPWLLATITSGTACALLTGVFELTLAKSLILAFFLTLVLGLAESVSIQSMTMAIHTLKSKQPDLKWYIKSICREVGTAILLGFACGFVVGIISFLWRGNLMASLTIGTSIMLTLCSAVFFGLSIPSLLHRLKLDMRIASGPLTLAFTDISTVVIYFSIATLLL
ncbi:MAG: magnesium transporter [Desulforegulaceae bacterium]|jgi:magnesium transporter|nr:magnesium transporter [Desulforegulaceae bacterium]